MAELPLQSITIGSNKYILSGSGSVDSTSEPTADTVAEFDSDAHMNSTDMDASEINDFVDGLNVSGSSINGLMTLNPWVSISATGFTGNNTATKVTGTTIRSGGNASDYFDTSVSDQVTIKRAGTYKITIFFRVSAITSAGNVKRISCYNNDSEFCTAMSRTNSWEDTSSTTIASCNIGDVLTMYKRAEDGNSTYAPALILIEALNSTAGNISAEADYVVEQGTSGNWKYRKWNSGDVELWGVYSATLTHYMTVNSWYAYNTGSVSLPFTVYSPETQISAKVGSGFAHSGNCYFASDSSSISTITGYCIANSSGSQTTVWHFDIKGRWK